MLGCGLEQRVHFGFVGDVRAASERLDLEFFRDLFCGLLRVAGISAVDEDIRSGLSEHFGHVFAESLGAAGDPSGFSGQREEFVEHGIRGRMLGWV